MRYDPAYGLQNNRRVAMGLYVTIYIETELRNKFYSKNPVAIKKNLNQEIFSFALRKQTHT